MNIRTYDTEIEDFSLGYFDDLKVIEYNIQVITLTYKSNTWATVYTHFAQVVFFFALKTLILEQCLS